MCYIKPSLVKQGEREKIISYAYVPHEKGNEGMKFISNSGFGPE